MHHSRGIYEHQRAATSEKRVVNLTRSGYPGQQRYGAITWSGDTAATWDTFRRQIADGLNFTVTGNPRWTLDIGGFFVDRKEQWFWRGDYPDGCTDPAYRELYVRWFQLGAFLPMFRSHGTDTPREVWRFGSPGDAAYDTLMRFLHLRYRLLPYIYSIAAWETLFDYTMLRMLAFDFRDDPKVYDIADQFMFGPALMVCPVATPAAKTRKVYLPAGTWYDFWTGEKLEGGRTIEAAAPLDILPLFVRAGSILPMGPIVQHSGEGLEEPLEVRVYGGADDEFTLYEDDNDGYACERGEYRLTKLKWTDAAQEADRGLAAPHARRRSSSRLWQRCRGIQMNRFDSAKWIAAANDLPSLPIFRRSISLHRPPKRAVVHICGLGQFELRVNLKKAGDDELEPAWSNYAKTCYYVTHDITALLHGGENIIDAWLGNGMYNVGAGKRYKKFKGSFGPSKLIAAVELDDVRIVSDEAWKVAPGPITFSCIYGGEDHDARRETPTDWKAVRSTDGPGGQLVPQISPSDSSHADLPRGKSHRTRAGQARLRSRSKLFRSPASWGSRRREPVHHAHHR
jgi:hypothetical protein